MNKKIIAIAIAAAMAAPVAMADVKMSGRVNAQYGIVSVDGAATDPQGRLDDSGQGRFQIDATSGQAYARWAIDTRYGRDRNDTNVTIAADGADADAFNDIASSGKSDFGRTNRDSYVGYKFDGFSLQYGRMGGAGKNIEKDPYIATFLQIRNNQATEAATSAKFGSSSFVDDVIQLSTKVGGAKVKVQLNIDDTSGSTSSSNEGHVAASVVGKAGAVKYWASYNNGSADGASGATPANDDSNIKVGAAMKFGKITGALNYTTADNDGVSNEVIVIMANMGMGNGLSGNAAIALASGDAGASADATTFRLAVTKKLAKGVSAYAGYVSTDYDTAGPADVSILGAGMTVKF